MKKLISVLTAVCLLTQAAAAFPVSAAEYLLHADFESGLDGWGARASETVAATTSASFAGTGSASISGRTAAWNGISHSLSTDTFKPGTAYSFSVEVMQKATPAAVDFKFLLQYSSGGTTVYDSIAEKSVISGSWTALTNTSYTIPSGATNLVLYIETAESTCDFYVDEIAIAADGVAITPGGGTEIKAKRDDVNQDGQVNGADAAALQKYLLGNDVTVNKSGADLDGNDTLNAADLSLLKRLLMAPPAETTTTTQSSTVIEDPPSGEHQNPKEHLAKVRDSLTWDVPANVKANNTGSMQKITYHSNKANRDKPANVWVPKGYSDSQKYCVLYMNHGVMGNEDNMTSDWSITEMASYFIDSGEVQPFIIVFPQMYTDPGAATPGFNFNMDMMDHYDDYFYDLTESLMPYIEQHYSVKTGRENTAIAGFSMGGRESLYCTISAPDKFGYCAASSPAPGIVPASDNFISNHLGSYIPGTNRRMQNGDFKISDDQLPYLLMIAGGTADTVVGTFPKEYHELFTANGTEHIWREVPGAGHDNSVGTPLFYNFFRALFKA
ncbi:MAG: carbohydrate binding domain-containing protein [Eubacterium sp.]|nr:carbohydrate binding domain-containing protein [Eubacterium sp.]